MALKTFERLTALAPPPVLYHYTTQTGLLGILEKDSLWATKIHFLNDSSEYALAFDLASDVLRKRIKTEKNSNNRKRLECLLSVVPNLAELNICVVSFTEVPDSLGQWRAYGGMGRGYALGFHGNRLQSQAKDQYCALAKCIYAERKQRQVITELIQETMKTDFPTEYESERPSPPGGDFMVHLSRLAPLLKHRAFREEKEWRVISRAIAAPRLNFRPGRSTVVPYFQFELGSKKPGYLTSLTVGPGPEMKLALGALQPLAVRWDLHKHVQLIASQVPYRNW